MLGTLDLNKKRLFLPLVLLVLGSSCYAEPFRIVTYGDSITYGWAPNPNPPSTRYDFEDRWPGALQKALGSNYQVIEEGLDGRTTVHQIRATASHRKVLAELRNPRNIRLGSPFTYLLYDSPSTKV